MLREEPLHFAENQHDKQKKNITISTIQQNNNNNNNNKINNSKTETNRIQSTASSTSANKKKKKIIVKHPIKIIYCHLIKNNSTYHHRHQQHQRKQLFIWKKYDTYHLPSFLKATKLTSSSTSSQHVCSLWMNATLKPDLKPIFWMNLSSDQQLINRSRLKKRLNRYHRHQQQHIFQRRILRKNDKSQWYGIFPIPPTLRTRYIWLTQQDDSHLNLSLPFSTTMLDPLHHQRHINNIKNQNHEISRHRIVNNSNNNTNITINTNNNQHNTIHNENKSSLKKHCHHRHNHNHQEEQRQQQKIKLKTWIPPINSETLQELCMANIFRSIQLRHDLLFDPGLSFRPNLDGASGREKCKKAEKYWRKVDKAFKELQDLFFSSSSSSSLGKKNINEQEDKSRLDFLFVLFTELRDILISLYHPFANSPASHEPWPWPQHITLDHLKAVLDVDFILQQIKYGQSTFLDPFIKVLYAILTPLCPMAETPRLELLKQYLAQEKYAKALRQCFSILETIKLDCANRILRDYRVYLVETCAQVEFQCFRKQLEQEEIRLDSTYKWLLKTWQRVGNKSQFIDVYHKGLVYLISDDIHTIRSLGLKSVPFPITLQFNERRITQQFRHEFQNILLVFILLIPYRYLAGNFATLSDMTRLKRSCIELCKDSMINWSEKYGMEVLDFMSLFNQPPCTTLTPEEYHKEVLRICYKLAYKVCHRAFQAHIRNLPASSSSKSTSPPPSLSTDQLIHVSQFWANWLMIHLKTNSSVYNLIYHRLCHLLSFISQYGVCDLEKQPSMISLMDCMVGIQENIIAFGEKIKMLADLNLATFGPIYRVLSLDIIQSI